MNSPMKIQIVTERLPVRSTSVAKKEQTKPKSMRELVAEDNSILIDYNDPFCGRDLFIGHTLIALLIFTSSMVAAGVTCY